MSSWVPSPRHAGCGFQLCSPPRLQMLQFVLTFALEAPNPAGGLAHLGHLLRLVGKGQQALVSMVSWSQCVPLSDRECPGPIPAPGEFVLACSLHLHSPGTGRSPSGHCGSGTGHYLGNCCSSWGTCSGVKNEYSGLKSHLQKELGMGKGEAAACVHEQRAAPAGLRAGLCAGTPHPLPLPSPTALRAAPGLC